MPLYSTRATGAWRCSSMDDVMTDEQHSAFLRGFALAQPPGPDDAEAFRAAQELAQATTGQTRIVVSKDLGAAFLAELDALPEYLAGAAWSGFLRGMAAHADGAPVHVHESGRA